MWNTIKDRLKSPVALAALLALIYFVVKNWFGFEIPDWDKFTSLLPAALLAFGILNDPSNKNGF